MYTVDYTDMCTHTYTHIYLTVITDMCSVLSPCTLQYIPGVVLRVCVCVMNDGGGLRILFFHSSIHIDYKSLKSNI